MIMIHEHIIILKWLAESLYYKHIKLVNYLNSYYYVIDT